MNEPAHATRSDPPLRTLDYKAPEPQEFHRRIAAALSFLGISSLMLGALFGIYTYGFCIFAAMNWEHFWREHSAGDFLVPLGIAVGLITFGWLCLRFGDWF